MESNVEEKQTKRRASFADTMSAPVYSDAPSPPYTFAIEQMLWCTVTIDPAKVAPLVPEGLRMGPDGTAHFALFNLGIGWGLRNSSCAFPGVVIEDFPSPDTAEAAWIPAGVMDGAPAALMRQHYGAFSQGHTVVTRDGNLMCVEVFSPTGPILTARVRVLDVESSEVSSIDRYIGRDQGGRLMSSLVSVTMEGALPVEFQSLEIAAEAPQVWQAFAPLRLNWAATVPIMLANWSEPSPIYPGQDSPAARASREALLALLNEQGRACAILHHNATVAHCNARARALLPLGPRPDMFANRGDWQRFLVGVAGVASGRPSVMPGQFAARRHDQGMPIILQLEAIDPAICGPNHALLLVTDPEAGLERPISGVLQLLGLTPAEARIAAAVGRGLAPRMAAEALGVQESTIRSALKVIFAKLDLSRQTDLVALVARLVLG